MPAEADHPVVHTLTFERVDPEVDGVDWCVSEVELEEGLDEPYVLRLRLSARSHADVPLEPLVGARLWLRMERAPGWRQGVGGALREITGVVLRAEGLGARRGRARVHLTVGPALSLASRTLRSRCFDGQTVPEIVREVVGAAWVDETRLTALYVRRDFCVQYRETDLAFVQRILAEEGIAFTFEAGPEHERMVLRDDVGAEASSDALPPELRVATRGEVPSGEHIVQAARARCLQTKRVVATAWDWLSAAPQRLSSVAERPAEELPVASAGHWRVHTDARIYEEGGAHLDPTERIAALEMERRHADAVRVRVDSNALEVRPGWGFELVGHPHRDLEGEHVVVRALHRAEAPEDDDDGVMGPVYANTFECLPRGVRHRPARLPRPSIAGVQTAIVVGDEGSEVDVDRHGRVRLRFAWDESDRASCRVRVAHAWAGAGFGASFVPRVGMEVVVAFVEGNPERPVVTGCVHHGGHPPAWALPEHKTRSGVVTRSVPDGEGFNELRFEDARGAEEVFLRAQRNLRESVRANHRATVGGARHVAIGGEDELHVGQGRAVCVDGSRHTCVGSESDATDELKVRGERSVAITQRWRLAVAESTEVEATATALRIRAPEEIRLEVGGSRLVIRADRITLESGEVFLASEAGHLRLDRSAHLFGAEAASVAKGSVGELSFVGQRARLWAERSVVMQQSTDAKLSLSEKEAQLSADVVELAAPDARAVLSSGSARTTARSVHTTAVEIDSEAAGKHTIVGRGEVHLNPPGRV